MLDHDKLVAEIQARKTGRKVSTHVPGQEAYEVTIEQGQDALKPHVLQNDVTIRSHGITDTQAKRVHGPGVTQIVQPSNEPKEADVITFGDVRLFPNPLDINTYEAVLTRGGSDPFVVEKNGRRLSAHAGLKAIYEALRSEQDAKKGGK